jgi:AraC-like DNA-binding protein
MVRSQVLAFSDPLAYQAAVRAADVEVLVKSRGDFRAELTRIDLDRLWIQRGYDSLPRIVHAANDPKRSPILFLDGVGQSSLLLSGLEVSAGEMVVYSSGSINHQQTSGPCRWATMSLTPEDLAAAGRAIAGRELTAPSDTLVVRPARAVMERLMTLHAAACQLAKGAPDILTLPGIARALEQELVRALVACLTERPLPEAKSCGGAHAKVIARFEDFLAARRYEPLYLAEICAGISVSERTLRTCCHEHLGMGPVRYLWLRRMHLARRALLLSDAREANVTRIATDFGFWELGRFSVEYRTLFGESPSAALHRSGDRELERDRTESGPLPILHS